MQKEESKKISELDLEVKKKKAFGISIKEGVFASMSGLGDSLIAPFATAIGTSALQLGFINSFSGLVSPLAQIKGDRLMEKYTRKKIVVKSVLFNALMWLPIALLGLLYSKQILVSWLPWILIVLYTILAAFGGLAHPAWFSWMGDLLKDNERGKYLAKRNVYIGIAGTLAVVIGGLVLQKFKATGFVFIGFGLLFFLSFLFRFISHSLIRKQYEPKFKLEKKSYFSFWSFIKRYDNYGKFSVYQAFFNLAIMIASPFFALYMLKNLGYENNYLLYMVVSFSSTVFYLVFTPLVGKFSDKYGNLKLIWVANIIFALNPLIWIFVKTPLQIIFIPQLITGLANAASTLATANYTYDSVSQQNRGLCVAYTNTLIGAGVFVGSIIGGFLLDVIPNNAFFIVFGIAGITRLLVGLFFLPQLKEVRVVSKLKIPSASHLPIHFHLSNPLRHLHMGFNPFIANKTGKIK